jgi:hypothetical protein
MRKQRQSQDTAKVKVRMGKRREKVALMTAKGLTTREISKKLKAEGFQRGSSHVVVSRDIRAISRLAPENLQAAREEAAEHLAGLRQMIENAEGLQLTQMVPMLLAVHDRYALLAGLNAATRSVSTKVTIGDPQTSVGYTRFIRATARLTDEQVESVYEFIASIPEVKTLPAAPPETSPLWEEK